MLTWLLIAHQVAGLGDSDFHVRDRTEKAIAVRGMLAWPVLYAGALCRDVEIQRRCQRITGWTRADYTWETVWGLGVGLWLTYRPGPLRLAEWEMQWLDRQCDAALAELPRVMRARGILKNMSSVVDVMGVPAARHVYPQASGAWVMWAREDLAYRRQKARGR